MLCPTVTHKSTMDPGRTPGLKKRGNCQNNKVVVCLNGNKSTSTEFETKPARAITNNDVY